LTCGTISEKSDAGCPHQKTTKKVMKNTLPKINMSPEKKPFQKEKSNQHVQGKCYFSGEYVIVL